MQEETKHSRVGHAVVVRHTTMETASIPARTPTLLDRARDNQLREALALIEAGADVNAADEQVRYYTPTIYLGGLLRHGTNDWITAKLV